MNPYGSPSGSGRPPARVDGFKDRSTALAFFGVLHVVAGLFLLGLAALVPVAQSLSARALGEEARYFETLPSVLLYVMLATILLALGIGSIRVKRWAGNLVLVVSWAWLASGALTLIGLVWLLPASLDGMASSGGLPPEARLIVLGTVFAIMSFVLVILPGVFVVFYRAGSVRATFQARDPGPDWTEACPLPVLAVSLWIFVSALFLFAMPTAVNGTMPVFGYLVSGPSGYLLYWVVAALWAYGALGLYRLQSSSWWVVFLSSALLGVSYLVTLSLVDPLFMYERMGYSEQQLAMMRQIDLVSGPQLVLWVSIFLVPYLGYLLYLKKFFPRVGVGPA